jgi:predicted lipoprotein with Yx(FWY)xxD motif
MTSLSRTTPMKSLLMLAIISSLTACGGSSNKSADTTAPVQQRMTNLGEVFTDNAGMTLYTFNKDKPSISNCNDGCATKWPPLLAKDDAQAEGRFSIITRADNSKQWALDKSPLYRWINDSAPGDTTGEEVKSLWYVAQVPPISKWNADVNTGGTINKVTVLTDTNHKTLYAFTNDKNKPNGSSCNDGCAIEWPPLLAEKDAKASGNYSLVTRDNGDKQWAYHGIPLYRFVDDNDAGDTIGENDEKIWFVAQPLPISKYSTTNQGIVLSDPSWLSLYVLDNETTSKLVCKGPCLKAWPPLFADDKDINRGDYTHFVNSEGKHQWAYKDQPLYHWKTDKKPNDINGQGLAHPSGGTWVVAKP